jgi:hypothetical protein
MDFVVESVDLLLFRVSALRVEVRRCTAPGVNERILPHIIGRSKLIS